MRPISSCAGAAIALLVVTAGAHAANPGAVRITDRASAAVNASPASYGSYSGPVAGYGDCNQCPPGHGCCLHGCNPLACAHCLATYPCHRLHDALHSYIGVTQSLAQPADPIYRLPVHYQRFWPTHWYGQPGAVYTPTFPMVYMPTDTTQLGFYYQRAPYWQPRPAMLSAAGITAGGEIGVGGGMGAGGYIESPGVIGPNGGAMDYTPPPPLPPAEASNGGLRGLLGLN